ncbi:MAG: hypothetical protein V1668_01035 [Patescibacteria group bacterium]
MTNNLPDIPALFLERAKRQKRKIAITIKRPIPETIDSLRRALEFADLTVIGARVDGFNNIVEPDEDKASGVLIKLLKDGEVDGIVRGQVKDSFTLDEFHRQFGRDPLPSNRKVAASVLHKAPYTFCATTVSIYQGLTLEDKIYEVERTIRYMREDIGLEPKIGIMSSLRPTSKVGKYPSLDSVASINTQLAEYLRKNGYDTMEYYFEYETAVWNGSNLIVPSMGLVGNAWLKALLYLGGWELLTCQYLDLGVVYEDGTRNEKDFFWHIVSAVATANSRK